MSASFLRSSARAERERRSMPEGHMMRFCKQPRRFYCCVDLHARSMYVCVVDQAGGIIFHEDLPANAAAFYDAVAPFCDGLVVACECLSCWYWLADCCIGKDCQSC